jgi:hypothetical protein
MCFKVGAKVWSLAGGRVANRDHFNLVTFPGYFDIALRDFGLFVAAAALGWLATRYAPRAVHVVYGVTAWCWFLHQRGLQLSRLKLPDDGHPAFSSTTACRPDRATAAGLRGGFLGTQVVVRSAPSGTPGKRS